MSMGHVLPRFRHKHGMILSRSVAADRPLESYCIGHDLAAMAAPRCLVMRRSGVYRAGPVWRGGPWPVRSPVSKTSRGPGCPAQHGGDGMRRIWVALDGWEDDLGADDVAHP